MAEAQATEAVSNPQEGMMVQTEKGVTCNLCMTGFQRDETKVYLDGTVFHSHCSVMYLSQKGQPITQWTRENEDGAFGEGKL